MNARMRNSAVLIPVLLLAALGACASRAGAVEVTRVSEKVIPFTSGGEVKIEDENGRLTVKSWSRNDVRVQITRVVRLADPTRAAELMKDLQAEVIVHSDRIEIESRFPKRHEGILEKLTGKGAALSIHYDLQVPEETDLVLNTSNGDVRVEGTRGGIEATTTNGDIRIAGARGEVTASTTNGEVRLSDVTGSASAHTTNGSVVAEVQGVPRDAHMTLDTTNGNVEAWFGHDLKADLTAETTNGRVSVDFPIDRDRVATSRMIRGTIQGGGAKIAIRTTNGNVDVRRLVERKPGERRPGERKPG